MRGVLLLAFLCLTGCEAAQPAPEQLVAGLAGPQAVEYFALLRQQADEDAARDAIVAGLNSPNARVRGQCARLLGTRRDVTLVDPLRRLLLDPNPTVRWQAARAVVPLVETRELVGWLRSAQLPVASRLVLARAMLVDPAELTEPSFVDWLTDPKHPEAYREALYRAQLEFHAPKYGNRRDERPLVQDVSSARQRIATSLRSDALDRRKTPDLRAAALQLYGALAGSRAFADIRRVTLSEAAGSPIHNAALLALGRSEDPRGVPILAGYIADRSLSFSVREVAVRGMVGLSRAPGAPEVLLAVLSAPEPVLRHAAAMGLASARDPKVLPALSAALTLERDPEVRRRIQASIAHLEGRRRRNARRDQQD
jgi:HEAT repeat protein